MKHLTSLRLSGVAFAAAYLASSACAADKIDFERQIKPVIELNCVVCHKEGHAKGGLRLDDKAPAFKGGDSGPALVPGDSAKSLGFKAMTAAADDDSLMPPKTKG